MIISALVVLVTSLLLGGPADYFIFPDLEKNIEKVVSEKDKRKKILGIIEEQKKISKKVTKQNKKLLKSIDNSFQEDNLDINTIEEAFNQIYNTKVENDGKLIQGRINIQELFTDEEWIQLFSRLEKGKYIKKEKKDKATLDLANFFNKSERQIKETVESSSAQKNILLALGSFEKEINNLNEVESAFNMYESEILRNRKASKEELTQLFEQSNTYRKKVYDEYIAYLKVVQKNTSKTEWASLYKSLNDILN